MGRPKIIKWDCKNCGEEVRENRYLIIMQQMREAQLCSKCLMTQWEEEHKAMNKA